MVNSDTTPDMIQKMLSGLEQDRVHVDIPECDRDLLPAEVVADPLNDGAEIDDSFDFDGFQIVRREFFAHLLEPSVTLSMSKVGFNTACLKKMPNVDYIQYMVDSDKKMLAVRPRHENASNSMLWAKSKNGIKKPRQISGSSFFAKLVALMNWNKDYKYKIIGRFVKSQGQYVLLFDLSSAEVFPCTIADGEKRRISRYGMLPEEWKNQFGVPYKEYRQSLAIKTFDNFAVISIQDNAVAANEAGADNSLLLPASDPYADAAEEHPSGRNLSEVMVETESAGGI